MGKISMNTSDDTNMFSVVNQLDGDTVHLNTGDSLGVVDKMFVVWSRKDHELGLLRGKSNMVGFTVVKGEL